MNKVGNNGKLCMQAFTKIITVNGNNKRDLQLKIVGLNEIKHKKMPVRN